MQGFHQRLPQPNPTPQSMLLPDRQNVLVSNRRLQNMNCILEPRGGVGGLFLGDVVSTFKQDLLRGHEIRAILTCMSEDIPVPAIVASHKILPLKDLLDYPIHRHFDQAIAWIADQRGEGRNVLVHCHAGVSRSATIVIAYLIRLNGWSPETALQFVRVRRERAKPNQSFWQQLQDYHHFWSQQSGKLSQPSSLQPRENVQPVREHLHPQREDAPPQREVFQSPRQNTQPVQKVISLQNLPNPYLRLQQSREGKEMYKSIQPLKDQANQPEKEANDAQKPAVPQKRQKVSIGRRRKIFDRNELLQSCIISKQKNEVRRQYFITPNRPQQQILYPQSQGLARSPDQLFRQNKSALQPRVLRSEETQQLVQYTSPFEIPRFGQ